ncbi:MAG: TVP38/TMEM64 family protein [Nitrospirae bacterium]|nr:TVP38/TMEM64 family protein [Nitrospirota bacterium]
MWNTKVRRWIKPTAGLLVLGGLTWAGASYDLSRHASLEQVRSMVHSLGACGAFAFVGLCVGAVLLHIPEIVLIAIGGVLFGAVNGFLLGWIGSVAGSTCSFLIARYFMRDAVRRALLSRFERIQAIDERLARRGFRTILVLRLVLFMAPPLNWAIGVTRVRVRDYVLGSALGVVPCIAVTSYAADTVAQAGSLSALLTFDTLLPAAFVFIVATVGALVAWKFFR